MQTFAARRGSRNENGSILLQIQVWMIVFLPEDSRYIPNPSIFDQIKFDCSDPLEFYDLGLTRASASICLRYPREIRKIKSLNLKSMI